jgi:hypothetical protein
LVRIVEWVISKWLVMFGLVLLIVMLLGSHFILNSAGCGSWCKPCAHYTWYWEDN